MLEFSMDFMDVVNNSKILFTEGYQFTSDQNFKAFLSVLENTDPNVQLALSLSDPFIVSNFKSRSKMSLARELLIMFSVSKAIATGKNFVGGLVESQKILLSPMVQILLLSPKKEVSLKLKHML